jgi:SseB protein N-terminal domain
LVDNLTVRRAVGEFAAEPGQRRALEVLRSCMYGQLLFDVTGSDAFGGGATSVPEGSRLQIRGGTGPDGGRALFAFTRQEEIGRLYPPRTRTQSMVTPATGALGLARQQGDAWLYIDPAGPTCALSAAEIDFALRNPHNERLKEALAAFSVGGADRPALLHLIRTDGPMMLAADDSVPDRVQVRTMTHSDGTVSLYGFTSGPEVLAFNPADAAASLTTHEILDMIRDRGYRGLVVNPVGPSIAFSAEELFG